MHVKIPYGHEARLLDIPDGWVGNRVMRTPRAEPLNPLEFALETALSSPICSCPLGSQFPPGAEICLALDGASAPEALLCVTEALVGWMKSALGQDPARLHAVFTAPFASELRCPAEWIERVRALGIADATVHDPNSPEASSFAGALKNGVGLHLNRAWSTSRFRLAVSLVEPWPLWGYSGGRAIVLPGLACGATVDACLGEASRLVNPSAACGNLRDNPFHLLAVEAMQGAPPQFAVHFTVSREGQVAGVFAGDPVQSHLAAVNDHRERLQPHLGELMDIVVTGGGGYPGDSTLAGAIRSMLSAESLLKPDGTLIVLAQCGDGIGPAAFETCLRQAEGGSPQALQQLADFSPPPSGLWLACQLYRVLSGREVLIHAEGVGEDDLWAFGLTPVPDPLEAVGLAMETHGQDCKIAVIPDGWRTLVRLG